MLNTNKVDSKKAAERIQKIKETREKIKETNYKLSVIPGIGPKIEQKLIEIGINSAEKLMDADSGQLASKLLGVGSKSIKKWKEYLTNRDK